MIHGLGTLIAELNADQIVSMCGQLACAATIRVQPPEDLKPYVIKNDLVHNFAYVLPGADNNGMRSFASQPKFARTVYLRWRITSHKNTLPSAESRNPGDLVTRQATAPQHLSYHTTCRPAHCMTRTKGSLLPLVRQIEGFREQCFHKIKARSQRKDVS